MKNFFKYLFASFWGFILALIFIVVVVAIIGAVAGSKKGNEIKEKSVLVLKMDYKLPELTNNTERSPFEFENGDVLGIHDYVKAIEDAADDDKIKGILIEAPSPQNGIAGLSTVREAINTFKDSGKFVMAYSDVYSQGGYYLSSVADEIYASPVGMIDFRGFSAQNMYVKDMLDRLGIEMQVVWVGEFKSATEIFRRNDMSEENRRQVREFLNEYYGIFLTDIADARGLTVKEVHDIADSYLALNPVKAAESGLIDSTLYYDQILSKIREKLDIKEDKKINFTSIGKYYNRKGKSKTNKKAKDKIAVVYAEGEIVGGEGEVGKIGDVKYTKILRKLRTKDKVKAVVLRVNSPGGSALASDNIWREIELLKAEGKPVIVSMGDYAASGGYYISCNADSVFAEPTTLTGSIGVFSVIPAAQKMFNEKLGIHFDTVKTANYATGITGIFPMTEGERAILQERTNSMYDTFLTRVSEGRGISKDSVHAIAKGRVWTGVTAQKIGLVDALGGLDEAIAVAADKAGLEAYRTISYPQVKNPIEQFVEQLTGKDKGAVISEELLRSQLGKTYPLYKQIKDIQSLEGMQMRVPFIVTTN